MFSISESVQEVGGDGSPSATQRSVAPADMEVLRACDAPCHKVFGLGYGVVQGKPLGQKCCYGTREGAARAVEVGGDDAGFAERPQCAVGTVKAVGDGVGVCAMTSLNEDVHSPACCQLPSGVVQGGGSGQRLSP